MIDKTGIFLTHHLVAFLAVVLIPMKLVVLRICGDSEAQAGALLAIPEDICYVSLGLILGDIATSSKAFRNYFADSANVSMDIAITIALNVAVAAFTHRLAKSSNDHFRSFRAALYAPIPNSGSSDQAGALARKNFRRIQVSHLALFSISYIVQICVTIRWLAWIAKVLAYAGRST